MKKTSLALTLSAIGITLFAIILGVGSYNNLNGMDESISLSWVKVEASYQEHSELVQELVVLVMDYTNFENEALAEVSEANVKAASFEIDSNELSPEAISKYQSYQERLNEALSVLLLNIEKYPEIVADPNYQSMREGLKDNKMELTVEQEKFNSKVKSYNDVIRKFPTVVLANVMGFDAMGSFKLNSEP